MVKHHPGALSRECAPARASVGNPRRSCSLYAVGMTRMWRRIKRLFRIGGDDEPALVRNVPPQPLLSGAVALPLPHEPDDVDARGRHAD
jgi:hypothetical protein